MGEETTHRDFFVLDTSAVIGYLEILRPLVPFVDATAEKPDFYTYHHNILKRWEALGKHAADKEIPVRIPDYVIYELTGILPNTIPFIQKRLSAIGDRYAKLIEEHPDKRDHLLQEQARHYQLQIDILVDASVRLDRRRPLADGKSTVADRRHELTDLFTFFAYHPEVIVPTRVGKAFCENAHVESSVLLGVNQNHPSRMGETYDHRIKQLEQDIVHGKSSDEINELGHYTVSFKDVLSVPEVGFGLDDLRIHWGQMYFMGLIDEDHYSNYMRHTGGAEAANDQGYDTNKRFVTYASILNKTRETGLKTQISEAILQRVPNEDKKEREKILRHSLTFGELQRFVPTMDVTASVGAAKLTFEQAIFGGLLPGSSVKLKSADPESQDIELLRIMATALGYQVPQVDHFLPDIHVHLRNSLKYQGFFERPVNIEDLVRIQCAFHKKDAEHKPLSLFLGKLPTVLNEKPKELVRGFLPISTAPFERLFADALVSGWLNIPQFIGLLAALNPTQLHTGRSPHITLETPDVILHMDLKERAAVTARDTVQLAELIKPDSVRIEFRREGSRSHDIWSDSLGKLVESCRSSRRQGNLYPEGIRNLLEGLIRDSIRTHPARQLQRASTIFSRYFGEERGEALFFQLMKDFESRQERNFKSNDAYRPEQAPARCVIAANHRNRLIARRNLGEVSVVEVAQTLLDQSEQAKVWVIANDQDLVSYRQYRRLDPLALSSKRSGNARPEDPVTLGIRSEDPGIMLHPRVGQQHSRYTHHLTLLQTQKNTEQGEPRCYNVPTRDWLQYMSSVNHLPPINTPHPDDFTHKHAKASQPFRRSFGLGL